MSVGTAARRVARSAAVAALRQVPPGVTRRVPGEARTRALNLHSEVLRVRPVAFDRAPTPYGFALAGTTADLLQRNVYVFGFWEPNISRWVARHLSPGDVVVDVGANVGYFSLLAARAVGPAGRVYAFEPVPSLVADLRANLALNDVDNVEVVPAIASDERGHAEIFRAADGNVGMSGTLPGPGARSEGAVEVIRAEDAVDAALWPRIRLLKVDTEGHDLRALRGLDALLRAMPAGAAAIVEITPEELERRGQSADELVGFMRSAGFDEMWEIANSYDNRDYAVVEEQPPVRITATPQQQADVIFLKSR